MSPPQKLEWMMSGRLTDKAEISAPYWPWNTLGICDSTTLALGINCSMEWVKSFQLSCPKA
ncbi:hypothetical protein D3C78_1851890 [compost metagenome]